MYRTEGVSTIATVTELRSDASTVIDRVRQNGERVLIQKNNEPSAVLIDHETFTRIKDELGVSELSSLVEDS